MKQILFLVVLFGSGSLAAQNEEKWRAGLDLYWAGIDSAYRDTLHSPLPLEDRKTFSHLPRFEADHHGA